MERLEFLPFAQVEALPDVDERRHGRLARAQRARDHRPDVRRRDGLRRGVAGVPLVLVPRVQNEPQIARLIRADQRRAVHHPGDFFQPLADLDVVNRRIDRGKGAQDFVGFEPLLKRRVALRIPRLGVRHPAGHPENDDRVGGRRRRGGRLRLRVVREDLPRV